MRYALYVLTASTLFGVASCAGRAAELSPSRRQALAETITTAMNDYFAALRALDWERATACYAQDFRALTGGQWVTRDSAVVSGRRFFPSLQRFEGDWDWIDVTPLSADAVIAVGSFWQSFTDTTGVTTSMSGTVTWVWVRRDSDWRVVFVHAANDPGKS